MSTNEEKSCCNCGVRSSYLIAVLGALLIVGALVWAMKFYTTPVSITAQRAAERAKNLSELRAAEQQAMDTYGWVDQPKGIVRLTVDRAVELTVAGGQDWAAFRKELIAREEKATYVPPKAPEKPSVFE